jgi:polyphosphate glucokinase
MVVGIDVGGSSIKYAPVEPGTGRLLRPLASVPTPRQGMLDPLIQCLAQLATESAPGAPVGVALPSVIRNGVAYTAANLHGSLIGADVRSLLQAKVGQPVVFLNDADAAGIAEVRIGAGQGVAGTVMMLTFGTGIGSALFVDGHLVPNTELGHLEMNGREAEHQASARVRTEESLDWEQWSGRVNEYLACIHALFWPDLFIIGGGVSENFSQFGSLLRSPAEIRCARLGAAAGTVGAALAASGLQL